MISFEHISRDCKLICGDRKYVRFLARGHLRENWKEVFTNGHVETGSKGISSHGDDFMVVCIHTCMFYFMLYAYIKLEYFNYVKSTISQ